MSIELILGGIGTALGIANFVYWAWWSKRERIKVFNAVFCVWFIHKGAGRANVEGKWTELTKHSLMLAVDCELVITRGDKMEIRGVYLEIDKQPHEILNKYFEIPFARLSLETSDLNKQAGTVTLHPKKSIFFTREIICTGRDVLDELCDKENYPEQPEEDDTHQYYYKPPDFLKQVLDKTSTNYKIIYYRYDDKMVSWRFPDKWWRNLGKKLWG